MTSPGVIKRAVAAAAVGNITEWFDFGVYSYLEGTIETVFFRDLPPTFRTIATLGVFTTAFLVRPFGGMFFGPLGDRIGRTKVLSITVILMAIGTFCIGVLPGVATIGVAAPMLLLLARLVQGFSTGGEYGGAMTFIAEYAPDKRRGFLGSFLEFGTLIGYAMGATVALLVTFLPDDALLSWGWRIPFLIAGPLGIIGLYLRMKLEETPAFKQIADESEGREGSQTLSEIRSLFVKHWRPMVLCTGLVLVFNVTNYMLTVYVPSYLTKTLPQMGGGGGISDTTSQVLQIVVLLLLVIVITFIGRLSDRFGRRPVILTGSIALVVLSIPSVLLLQADTVPSVFFGLLLMGLMLVCFSATMPSTLPALFPTEVRYGGLSIAFNIAVSLFGGTTATVVGILVASTGDLNMPAYYLMAAGLIGAVTIYFTRESARKPLIGSPPSAVDEEEAKQLATK